jgi:protein-S-isoprenylcysteine O-methyltransferase Ste14
MKSLFVIFTFLFFSASVFSQTIASATIAEKKTAYLKKSKGQRTAAFILLGVGGGCFALAAPGNVDFDVLGTLVVIGAAATITSIPLFISAGKNKRRAMALTVGINMDQSTEASKYGISMVRYPALSLHLNL